MTDKKDEKALVKKESSMPFKVEFGTAELKLIKDNVAPDSTQAEFNLFVYDCQSRGLNPLKKEVYFVKRQVYDPAVGKKVGKATHQVAIDGFRIIAQRTGEYKGQTLPTYGPDMKMDDGSTVPEYVDIGVVRKGYDEPVLARAYFVEYAPLYNGKLGQMWKKMPRHMLTKCAESLAFRKAFPDTLAGLVTEEEMHQADGGETARVRAVEKQKNQTKDIIDEIRKAKSKSEVRKVVETMKEKDLTVDEAKILSAAVADKMKEFEDKKDDEPAKVEVVSEEEDPVLKAEEEKKKPKKDSLTDEIFA